MHGLLGTCTKQNRCEMGSFATSKRQAETASLTSLYKGWSYAVHVVEINPSKHPKPVLSASSQHLRFIVVTELVSQEDKSPSKTAAFKNLEGCIGAGQHTLYRATLLQPPPFGAHKNLHVVHRCDRACCPARQITTCEF